MKKTAKYQISMLKTQGDGVKSYTLTASDSKNKIPWLMTASPRPSRVKLKSDGPEDFLKASRINLSQLARGVADIVLVITFAYELGFR